MKHLIILAALLVLIYAPAAYAVSLSVAPSRLQIDGRAGEDIRTKLIVENPAPQVAMFEVYPDEFSDAITARPQSFILESGESRTIIITAAFTRGGQYHTDISVVARPVSDLEFSAGGGLKIPFSATVGGENSSLLASVGAFADSRMLRITLILFLVAAVVVRIAAKKNRNHPVG